MAVGSLIFYLFWAVIIGWLAFTIIRGRLKPRQALTLVVERQPGVGDAPRDHVDFVAVLPNKATAKLAALTVDGTQVELAPAGDLRRSMRMPKGSHAVALKVGPRYYECVIDFPASGRYELHLKNDQLRGGLAAQARLVIATQG